ncbi:hypothetical protein F5X99DRAFT_405831 [Biscogniauxia marginata]|nr:hypothetical protein F5X99DRAFT_405831 [Biscogniauxia marginata]
MDSGARLSDAGGRSITPSSFTTAFSKSERVTLQVGERRFHTFRDTLIGESDYFAARLNRWNDVEEDGSYFVDANPELFQHLLSYLRRGNYPLFFDFNTQMFDHAKYLALLGEAQYFRVRKLEEWISDKRYLEAVKLESSTTFIPDLDNESIKLLNDSVKHNARMNITTGWYLKKVYVCPRGIHVHRGDPKRCGQACRQKLAQDGGDPTFEDETIPTAVIVTTKVLIDPAICMTEG